jgi:hypothetical protein
VAAGMQLQAEFVPSQEDGKEFKYVKDWELFIHGVAAALKSSIENGDVKPVNASGRFNQGFHWAVSKALETNVNRDLYRTDWSNLWEALSGNAVWNANAPSWQRYLYQLVVLACKHMTIRNRGLFAKSPEQVINAKMTKTWSFENKAVFSEYEISYMKLGISKHLDAYSSWLKDLKENWHLKVDNCLNEYGKLTKDIRPYDSRIASIATVRANAIYRSTKRGKKDICPPGLTREARLEYLSFAAWVQATNPTGLGPDDRIETKLPFNDDEAAAEQFTEVYLKIFEASRDTDPKIINPWLRAVRERANALLRKNDN